MANRIRQLLHALSRLGRLSHSLVNAEADPTQKKRDDRVNVLGDANEVDRVLAFETRPAIELAGTACVFEDAVAECAVGEAVSIQRDRLVLKGAFCVIHADPLVVGADIDGSAAA